MSKTDLKQDDLNTDKVVIKKYANRRLYDTAQSKYIVLQDVIDFINNGVDFKIEDAKSGEDITRTILNQIIFEQETQPSDFLFPLEFQKQLIRMYGETYVGLLPDFLTQSLSMFAQERNKMTQAWQDVMAQGTETFFKQSEALAKQNLELFQNSLSMFGAAAMPPKPDDQNKEEPKDKTDLENMQAQLDALQAQIRDMSE